MKTMKRTHSLAILFTLVVLVLVSLSSAQFGFSVNYNATSYDTSYESFILNLTYPSNQTNVNATFIYDSTAYTPTTLNVTSGYDINWTSLYDKLLFNHGFNDTLINTVNSSIYNVNATHAQYYFYTGINNASLTTNGEDPPINNQSIFINMSQASVNHMPNYTISVWVNLTRVGGYSSAGVNTMSFLMFEDPSPGIGHTINGLGAGFCTNGYGNISYVYGTGVSDLYLCGPNITDAGWQHIAFRRNDTAISLFHNGTLVDYKTTNLKGASNTSLRILNRYTATAVIQYTNGSIDELNFWNKSLTNAEIVYLSNTSTRYGSPASPSGTIFSYNLNMPIVNTITNKTFYWNFSSNEYLSSSPLSNTSFYNQTIFPVILDINNWTTVNNTAIRIQFKDEIDNVYINGTMDSSTWYYTGGNGDGTVNKTFTYTNSSYVHNYTFGVSPATGNLRIQGATLRISSTGYSSKTWTIPNSYYTNTSMANITIWLTSLADSGNSPVTIQVLDSISNSPVSNVRVRTLRVIDGNLTLINDGYTDDSGAVAYYLSPTVAYTITATKTGCTTSSNTVTPTSSLYTIFLSCTGSTVTNATYSSPIDGVYYQRTPRDGVTNPGHYTFLYYVNSSIYNLSSVRFELVSRGTILAINVTNATGSGICSHRACTLSLNYTLVDADQIKGRYYIMTNNSNDWLLLEGDAYWKVIYINTTDSLNAMSRFMQNFQELVDSWGSYECMNYTTSVTCAADTKCRWLVKNATIPGNITAVLDTSQCIAADQYNKREFDRFLISFFILAVLLIFLSSATGYDMAHPGAFTLVFTALIWGLSYYGLFYYSGLTASVTINKYLFALSSTLWGAATFISIVRRQNG